MGRKIPAKKHRGVKDPLVQQARRLQSVKDKINAPPRDPDEQPVPRSLTRLFQQVERPPHPKRPKRSPLAADRHGGGGGHAVARLRRLPGEAARAFGQRISGAMRALHQHRPLAYPEGESDAEGSETDPKGARMAWQRQRRARRTARRAAAQEVQAGQGVQAARAPHAAPAGLTRKQRRRALIRDKKVKKKLQDHSSSSEPVYERVPFGALAPAPPTLRPPRRGRPSCPAGARGLALTATLAVGAGLGASSVASASSVVSAASTADTRRRELARLQAVAAYRALKRNPRASLH